MTYKLLYSLGSRRRLSKLKETRENSSGVASNPGEFKLCHKTLRIYRPDLYDCRSLFMNHGFLKRNGVTWPEYISVHIATGDTRAAVIVSMDDDHFEIAAFTDELDCVAILRLPARFSDNYAIGQRFLTVNRYGSTNVAKDLIPGPGNTGRYTLFHPIIANFACSDQGALNERLQMIPHWEWDRAFTLGQEFRRLYPRVFRIGYPGLSRMEILSCGDRKQ